MRKFKVSLVATGVGAALALMLSGPVFAHNDDGNEDEGQHQYHDADSGNSIRDVDGSAVATDHASANHVELGDVSLRMYSANTTLSGIVQNNGSDGIHGNAGGDAVGGAVSSGALALAATGNGTMGGSNGAAYGGPAGSFTVANTIANSSFASASGIMSVSQNTGANALSQQGVTVQGNVSF